MSADSIHTRGRRTRPWADIIGRYRSIPTFEPMVRLVVHIAAAPYAEKIFAGTSMTIMVVAQTAEVFDAQEIIRVDLLPSGFELAVQERGFALDLAVKDLVLRVSVAEGIVAFESLLRAKRWT
jgi:hypothetical protein